MNTQEDVLSQLFQELRDVRNSRSEEEVAQDICHQLYLLDGYVRQPHEILGEFDGVS